MKKNKYLITIVCIVVLALGINNIIIQIGNNYALENNIEWFDANKSKTWHHLFDLDNVRDVDLFKLVENNIKEIKKIKKIS